MKYKAIFLDLDGTTVVPFAQYPSDRVVAAIRKADEMVHVCLATGRLLSQSLPIIKLLNLNGPCVIANGIQLFDPVTGKITDEIGLLKRDIPGVIEVLRRFEIEIRYFNGTEDLPYTEEAPAGEVLSLFNIAVEKKKADLIIDALSIFPDVVVHKLLTQTEGSWGLEICHVTATKQHGIFTAAKRLGIKTHEIIGVGDGYNDFPLLMACGLKVAMGNAVPELKAIADFIAPSVQEDGVATVIEKFILA